MYVEGDVPNVVNGGNNGGNGFGWGGDAWVLIILFALIFGWGNNGWGGNGGNNGALTRGDLCMDMNFNGLENSVRGIQQGICDSTFALNNTIVNGFNQVQQTQCAGFSGLTQAISTQGYESRLATQNLSAQLASCCCDLKSAIADNTSAVLGFLTNEKITGLQAENAALTAQLSQNSQTNQIINALRPVAQPAYITCSPFESMYGFGRNNNCGCGCGCN